MPWTQVQLLSLCGPYCSSIHISLQFKKLTELPAPHTSRRFPFRRVPRSIYERARDVARSHAGTEGFERSRHDRKRVEMRFAHLKRILRLSRLRLRGPRGAQDEFTLAAIAQNLRRMAKLITLPPPAALLAAPA